MSRQLLIESLMNQVLQETIQEEILQLLEDVILEEVVEDDFDEESREDRILRWSTEIFHSLIRQTIEEELYNIAVDMFDGLVLNHRIKVTGVAKLNHILYSVCDEMVQEIVLEVIDGHLLSKRASSTVDNLLDELIIGEVRITCSEVLDHYHMRAGISRFKQIQASAANIIMDKVFLNSLLKRGNTSDTPENQVLDDFASGCLNDMILDVLLSQSLALHTCSPKSLSLPNSKTQAQVSIDWFKDKFVTDVAVNVLLDMLVSRLDSDVSANTK